MIREDVKEAKVCRQKSNLMIFANDAADDGDGDDDNNHKIGREKNLEKEIFLFAFEKNRMFLILSSLIITALRQTKSSVSRTNLSRKNGLFLMV